MCNCSYKAIEFFTGEREYISATVRPRNPKETVVVVSASYRLIKGTETVEEGNCETDGADIRFLFEANDPGVFTLEMEAAVGAETVINKATVVVKE